MKAMKSDTSVQLLKTASAIKSSTKQMQDTSIQQVRSCMFRVAVMGSMELSCLAACSAKRTALYAMMNKRGPSTEP
eukprot:4105564-Pyramimonas_sp.AAC.2